MNKITKILAIVIGSIVAVVGACAVVVMNTDWIRQGLVDKVIKWFDRRVYGTDDPDEIWANRHSDKT